MPAPSTHQIIPCHGTAPCVRCNQTFEVQLTGEYSRCEGQYCDGTHGACIVYWALPNQFCPYCGGGPVQNTHVPESMRIDFGKEIW